MDWLKRFLGLSDRQKYDPGQYRNPSWEEIESIGIIQDGHNNSLLVLVLQVDFPVTTFMDNFQAGGMYDPFSSMFSQMNEAFGQMNDLFAQMDGIFSQMDSRLGGYHYYNPGQIIISEFPDNLQDGQQFLDGERRQAPRDQLLKVPDSSIMPDSRYPPYSGPNDTPLRGGDDDDDDDSGSGGGGHPGFSDHFGFRTFDPMSMFERFFGGFGGHPDQPMLPGPSDGPDEHHSRDSLLKKDSDLDDRDVSQLPSDGPRYSYEGLGPGYQGSGSGQLSPSQPKSMFRSTTTVRIRRPDGSIHEEKRYKDSTGREEVIVTDTKPDDES